MSLLSMAGLSKFLMNLQFKLYNRGKFGIVKVYVTDQILEKAKGGMWQL